MKRLILFGFIMLIMSSCNMVATSSSPRLPKTYSKYIFPNSVGDSWVYQYDDRAFNSGANETIKVSIVGEGKLPDGETAKLWKYEYPKYTDTLWVVSNDTVAKIYSKPCFSCTSPMPYLLLRYKFPLKTGNRWFTHVVFGDTTKVASQKTITVPAGSFIDSYKITKTVGYVTNSWTKDTLWFKNNVGLIQKSQFEYSLGPMIGNGYWKLQSYHIQ